MSPAKNFEGKDKVEAFLEDKPPKPTATPSRNVKKEVQRAVDDYKPDDVVIDLTDAAQPDEPKEPAVTDAITAAENFNPTTPSELVLIDGEWQTPTPNTAPPTEAETVSTNAADIEPPQDPYYTPNTPAPIPPDETHRLIAGLRGADPDVHEWLNQPEPEYDWLIPGLLERGDRLIITGPEGGGKTTLLRQMAVTSAAGIHPFTFENVDPLRVLYVDVENSNRFSRRQFSPLVTQAKQHGRPIQPGQLIPLLRDGIDLYSTKPDQEWLTDRVAINEPDLLIIGPLYKLADGDPNEEAPAKAVTKYLDTLRATYGVAIILEAHSPHGDKTGRPYGASLWKRWPEFGLEISASGRFRHWRGPRDERAYPAALTRGGEWPLTIATKAADVLWARISAAAGHHLFRPSIRDLEQELETSRSSISRSISANQDEWDALWDD